MTPPLYTDTHPPSTNAANHTRPAPPLHHCMMNDERRGLRLSPSRPLDGSGAVNLDNTPYSYNEVSATGTGLGTVTLGGSAVARSAPSS